MSRLSQMIVSQQARAGLTESEISARYGFSQQAFNTWKKGSIPRPKVFAALAGFLNITTDELTDICKEASAGASTTKIPDLGAPVMGRGTASDVWIDKFAMGYAKPAYGGCYAVRIDGKYAWVNPRLTPTDGNSVFIRSKTSGRMSIWPCSLSDGEEAHVVILQEMV